MKNGLQEIWARGDLESGELDVGYEMSGQSPGEGWEDTMETFDRTQ